MGEKKRRRLNRDKILGDNSYCIYCGGVNPANTLDHMPPRCIFRFKHRPIGFEYPSCEQCQSDTRKSEHLVGLFARMYPDAQTNEERKETADYIRGIKNNFPDIVQWLLISREDEILERRNYDVNIPGRLISLGHPNVINHLTRYAVKLTISLHFEETKRVLDHKTNIIAGFFTNAEAMSGKIPDMARFGLSSAKTIRQGRKNVSGQFDYHSISSEDGALGIYYSYFRGSFCTVGIVDSSGDYEDPKEWEGRWRVHKPGEPW